MSPEEHEERRNQIDITTESEELEEPEHEAQERLQEGLLKINPKKLKPNPVNVNLYGKEKVDEELLDSIREKGQLEPIIIGTDSIIISGHRRWFALKEINKELKIKDEEERYAICVVKHFESELDEKEAIVEANRQREKTPLQIYQEVKLLQHVYAERARQRQIAPLQKGPVELNSVQREGMKNESGRTSEILAKKTGVKRDKLLKIIHIGEAYETGDKDKIVAVNELNSGESTVDATFKKLGIIDIAKSDKPEAKYAQELVVKMNKPDGITPNQAEKLLKAHRNKVNIPAPTVRKLPEGTYNVIVANPPSIDDAMGMQITDAKNAALFLWASTENMKESIELMKAWGFKLKSIAVWDRDWVGRGTWFDGAIEFLLLGIRGSWKNPEYKPLMIFKSHINPDNAAERPSCVYEMAEKMFPGQQYLDPFVANGRENWGQPTIVESSDVQQNNDEMLNENLTNLNIMNDEHKSTAGLIPEIHQPIDQTITLKESELPEGSVQDINHWL